MKETTCPLCGSNAQGEHDSHAMRRVSCPVCGEYEMSCGLSAVLPGFRLERQTRIKHALTTYLTEHPGTPLDMVAFELLFGEMTDV
jgi:hypothetical protein